MIRLAVRVRAERAEEVLAELLELSPAGVEEVTLGDGTTEYAVYGAPGELPALPDLRAAAGGSLVEVRTSELADDWAHRWRAFHRPLVLGDELIVRPPWEPRGESAIDVAIDPGMAFGTGAHATTKLCLELMLELARGGRAQGPFLDLGCGSGVLAITAAKLGWAPVQAVDVETASVEATLANAAANEVAVSARRLDLRSQESLTTADTVAANLLGPLLRILAARMASGPAELRPQQLIVSGLLATEADDIAGAFARAGLHERDRRQGQEWAALLLADATPA